MQSRIECSAKTLKELHLDRDSVEYGDANENPFFSWYCHLFYFNRKKNLLFVNVLTRYPVLAIELSRNEIQSLNVILERHLRVQLLREGVSENVTTRFLEHLASPTIAKSKNRSIIGTAVEYERLLRAYIEYSPESDPQYTQTDMSLELARTPIVAMKPEPFPYHVFSNELLKCYGESGNFKHDVHSRRQNPVH